MGGGQNLAVTAPPTTLARMAHAVGVTPEQLADAGRDDAAEELRALAQLEAPAHGVDTPPLPPELDELIAIYVGADEDEREVIIGQVRFWLRALRPAKERR